MQGAQYKVKERPVNQHGVSDFCITVPAVDHRWRAVVNATALSAEDSSPLASACKLPHTRAHQCHPQTAHNSTHDVTQETCIATVKVLRVD